MSGDEIPCPLERCFGNRGGYCAANGNVFTTAPMTIFGNITFDSAALETRQNAMGQMLYGFDELPGSARAQEWGNWENCPYARRHLHKQV